MFGVDTGVLLIVLPGFAVIALSSYFMYKFGYNKGYMKAMRDSNQYR
jgi:hypothetical protein